MDIEEASPELRHDLGEIRMLAMDVDGVLTDGTLLYGDTGSEFKRFHVADGLGIVVLQQAGIPVAWISGRRSLAVERRAAELGVTLLWHGIRDKRLALHHLCTKLGVEPKRIVYIGDDWNDLPAFEFVGVPIAVSNAAPELKRFARMVTTRAGGYGAVREVCDAILDAQGRRDQMMHAYVHALSQDAQTEATPM